MCIRDSCAPRGHCPAQGRDSVTLLRKRNLRYQIPQRKLHDPMCMCLPRETCLAHSSEGLYTYIYNATKEKPSFAPFHKLTLTHSRLVIALSTHSLRRTVLVMYPYRLIVVIDVSACVLVSGNIQILSSRSYIYIYMLCPERLCPHTYNATKEKSGI